MKFLLQLMYPEKIMWVWDKIGINKENESYTLKAYARVAVATDGDVFDRLVVVFLKRTLRCIRTARLGALWPIREIGPDWRSSIGLPLLLIVGAGSSTCWNKNKYVANKVKDNKGTEVSVKDLQFYRGLCSRSQSCHDMYEPIPWTDAPSILPTNVYTAKWWRELEPRPIDRCLSYQHLAGVELS